MLDLVVERVAGELQPSDASEPSPEWLRHVAREWRRLALAYPHVFPLVATGPPPLPPSLVPIIEGTLGALREVIKDDEQAATYFWTLLAFTTGALLAECAAAIGGGSPSRSVPTTVDHEVFPHLTALESVLAAVDLRRSTSAVSKSSRVSRLSSAFVSTSASKALAGRRGRRTGPQPTSTSSSMTSRSRSSWTTPPTRSPASVPASGRRARTRTANGNPLPNVHYVLVASTESHERGI